MDDLLVNGSHNFKNIQNPVFGTLKKIVVFGHSCVYMTVLQYNKQAMFISAISRWFKF